MSYSFTIIKILKDYLAKESTDVTRLLKSLWHKKRLRKLLLMNNENYTFKDTRGFMPHLLYTTHETSTVPAVCKIEGVQEPEDLFLSLSSWATLGESHNLFEHPWLQNGSVTPAPPPSWGCGEGQGRWWHLWLSSLSTCRGCSSLTPNPWNAAPAPQTEESSYIPPPPRSLLWPFWLMWWLQTTFG